MKSIFVITPGDVVAFVMIGVGVLVILGLFTYAFISGKIKNRKKGKK